MKGKAKIGDIFNDNGLLYRILEILPNGNYISEYVKPAEIINAEKSAKSGDEQ